MITYPLNNIDYTAEDAELFHCTRTSGIWAEDSFPISVTGADNNVTIGTGIAWINNEEFSGKVSALKSAEVLDLGIADGVYPRIDVIAIQYSANNNATDVVIKKGTPATNPVRPAIVRSGAVYELYIASVYRPAGATVITASNITDLRMDETVCGLMADSVTKVDMTAIEAQVRAFINNLQSEIDSIRDLSGLMFESEWVEDGVIPISKSGTGATTAEEALANLGGLKGITLWENSSPASSYGATTETYKDGEVVTENDLVAVCFRQSVDNDTEMWGYGRLGKSSRATMGGRIAHADGEYSLGVSRVFEVNERTIHFNSGSRTTTIANATTTGTVMIPQKVVMLKGALK